MWRIFKETCITSSSICIFEWISIGFLCKIFLDIVYISILDPFVGFIPINLRMCVCVGFQPQVTIEISTMHKIS
jgi:hypothetical protein